ncbi:MAG: hypothetical protein V1918_08530 [Planctomycetota bacterium]
MSPGEMLAPEKIDFEELDIGVEEGFVVKDPPATIYSVLMVLAVLFYLAAVVAVVLELKSYSPNWLWNLDSYF